MDRAEFKRHLREHWKLFCFPLVIWLIYCFRYHSISYAIIGIVLIGILVSIKEIDICLPFWSIRSSFWVLGFIYLFLGLFQYFNLVSPADVDTACSTNSFWNLLHGNLFNSIYAANTFSAHSDYLIVAFLPFFAIAGNPGIIIAQWACLIAAIYFFTRELDNNLNKLIFILTLFLVPQIGSKFLFGFHTDSLGAPLLVLAMVAYHRRNLGLFMLLTLFLTYTKEIFILGIGGMLLLALVELRNWKWYVYPGILGLVLNLIYLKGIMPALNPAEGHRLSGYMPDSLSQWLMLIFRGENWLYVFQSYAPFLPLLLAAGKKYLLLPLPLVLFYLGFPDPSYRDIWRHYGLAVGIMSIGALIFVNKEGLKKAALATFVCMVLSYPSWRGLQQITFRVNPRTEQIAAVKSIIPRKASVIVHGPFVAHFADRKWAENWIYASHSIGEFDYVLLDKEFMPEWWDNHQELHDTVIQLQQSDKWNLVYNQRGLFLFEKKESS